MTAQVKSGAKRNKMNQMEDFKGYQEMIPAPSSRMSIRGDTLRTSRMSFRTNIMTERSSTFIVPKHEFSTYCNHC